MKRGRTCLFMAFLVLLAGLGACGAESDNGDASQALSLFGNEVKLCTPYLDDNGQDLGQYDLSEWNAWNPLAQDSVLGKVFNPDIGQDECLHPQIAILDRHIAKVNEFNEHWEEDGTYTIGDMTAVVDNDTSSVNVPYLGPTIPVSVDRQITLTDSGDDLTVHMAFRIEDDEEYIVEQYTIGSTQAGVYYTERDGDALRIWHASVRSSKVQFTWEGNTNDKWFKFTECTDATGNWEVMGGGSIAASSSRMAFMARNDYTSNSADEYYLTISVDELDAGDEPAGGIIDAGITAPNGSGVLAYITEGSDECFGFLDEYPSNVHALDWNN